MWSTSVVSRQPLLNSPDSSRPLPPMRMTGLNTNSCHLPSHTHTHLPPPYLTDERKLQGGSRVQERLDRRFEVRKARIKCPSPILPMFQLHTQCLTWEMVTLLFWICLRLLPALFRLVGSLPELGSALSYHMNVHTYFLPLCNFHKGEKTRLYSFSTD